MGKFSTYMLVLSGFFLLFYLFGLNDGFTGNLMDLLLNIGDIGSSLGESGSWKPIALIISYITLAGVSAIITRSFFSESLVLAALLPFLLAFAVDFVTIYNMIANTSMVIALLVISPMLVLYVFTVIEWWRGVST